jgi:Xaa-Pro aminopeptidase
MAVMTTRSDGFTSEFFAGNRERLRQLFTGTAPIVVTANGLLQRGGDSTYPFQQDANFWYLTGISEPDVILVIDKAKDYLIVPARGETRVAFDGSVDAAELTRTSGIQTVYDDKEGWRQLEARLKRAKHVATLSPQPAYIEEHGLYTNPARAQLVTRMRLASDTVELLDLSQHMALLRVIKQPEELTAIRRAIDVTIDTLEEVMQPSVLHAYAHEYEIEADLTRGFRNRGAGGHAFEPIVAGGERACTLHNVANDGELSSDELLLLDVGAEVDQYAADITRTISLSEPSRRQQAVFDAVLEVQEFAFGLLKPGALIKDNEKQIEEFMGEKLRELGLIKTIDHDEVRKFYPHATSHFLGLNVHDIGDYTRPLEVGMVLTVEPGIYVPDEHIGVRIEDDVLITENGYEILTARLPRHLG